jgi:hypothetical protein
MDKSKIEPLYKVDDQEVNEEELNEMTKNPGIRLKKLGENTFKTLKRMFG